MSERSRNPETDEVVHLGVTWTDDGPSLRTRGLSARTSVFESVIGREFRYRSDGRRVCLGHTASREGGSVYVDCRKDPAPARKCDRCQTVDAVFAANMHQAHRVDRGTIDRRFVGHLTNTNWLYIAGFRDGSIKVGTSVDGRRFRRLAEQGAWEARFVARTEDGFVVRELEDRVTEELGIAQAVAARRKLDGLVRPVEPETLTAQIDSAAQQVAGLAVVMGDPAVELVDEAWHFDGATDDQWDQLHPYPLDLGRGAHRFVVETLCGRFAAVSSPGTTERFVVDLAGLFGLVLTPGSHESDELVVQGSLF